jgi:hypothetical protein
MFDSKTISTVVISSPGAISRFTKKSSIQFVATDHSSGDIENCAQYTPDKINGNITNIQNAFFIKTQIK